MIKQIGMSITAVCTLFFMSGSMCYSSNASSGNSGTISSASELMPVVGPPDKPERKKMKTLTVYLDYTITSPQGLDEITADLVALFAEALKHPHISVELLPITGSSDRRMPVCTETEHYARYFNQGTFKGHANTSDERRVIASLAAKVIKSDIINYHKTRHLGTNFGGLMFDLRHSITDATTGEQRFVAISDFIPQPALTSRKNSQANPTDPNRKYSAELLLMMPLVTNTSDSFEAARQGLVIKINEIGYKISEYHAGDFAKVIRELFNK